MEWDGGEKGISTVSSKTGEIPSMTAERIDRGFCSLEERKKL